MPESFIMQVQLKMVNNSFPVTSNSGLVPLIKIATLEHVHTTIKKLFKKSISNAPLVGRLLYFVTAWGKILRIKKFYLL